MRGLQGIAIALDKPSNIPHRMWVAEVGCTLQPREGFGHIVAEQKRTEAVHGACITLIASTPIPILSLTKVTFADE
jgi:hypothetical protein